MADRAKTENTTDTIQLLRPRRSSILKATRPPLEDVDQNVTGELGEKRRLSKRVSFSDTHEIKLFNCEVSEEHGSCADNVFAKPGLPMLRVKTDDLFSSSADTLVAQSHEQHNALEQSFYCSEDGAGNDNAVCHSERTLVLMEDALSCLVFNEASSVGAAGKRASSACPNRTTLASENMDLTYANASSVHDQLAVDGNTASACHEKAMDMTCANTSSMFGQFPIVSVDRNASTAGLKTMDLTCAAASFVLDQMTADCVTVAGRNSTSGRLNKTMHFHESMNMTCEVSSAAEQKQSHSTAAHGGAPSGDVVVYLLETMKMTCASGTMDLATDATTTETESDAVGHVYQTTDVAAVQSVEAVPKVTAAEESCGVSKLSQRFDLGFVTFMRTSDASNVLGDDDSPARTARGSATMNDTARIADPVVTFNLPTSAASMQMIDASDTLEDDVVSEHRVVGASVLLPCDATRSNECGTSAETTEVQEISNVALSPAVGVSLLTNHLPVTMSITGLDISGTGILNGASFPSDSDLPSTKGIGSWTAMQPQDAEHITSRHMSLTCAFPDGLNNESLTPAAPLLADVTSFGANHEQFNGSTSHDYNMQGEAAGNGGSLNPGKACLMTVTMDVTCASTAAPVVIEQEAELTSSKDSLPIVKTCKHIGKDDCSEEAVDPDNLIDLDGAGHQCSRAHGNELDSSSESARDCTAAAAGLSNVFPGLMGAMTSCQISLEPTLTSAPVLMPGSLLDEVALVEPAPGNMSSFDAAPQASLLPVEATLPSFHEAIPGHEATDGMRRIKAGIVITPIRPASSKSSKEKAMSSLKKRLAAEIGGDGTLTGKDSIALQQMVSPISRASRSAKAASSSKAKSINSTLDTDLSTVHRKFNAFLDSTVNGNISGLDVSALLATTAGDIDSIPGEASLPLIAQEKLSGGNGRGDMFKSSSKCKRQEPNGASRSRLVKSSGQDSFTNSGSAADIGKTASQVPAMQDEVLARQKNTRPSSTFAVLSPPSCDVVCIDGSVTDENAAGKSELPSAPADVPCASAAPHSSSAKRPIEGVHESSGKGSCGQSTATTRFRKRLEFAGLHEQPRGVQAGVTCNERKLDLAFDRYPISSSKTFSELSGQLPVSGCSRACSELHTSSAGSSSKIPYCGIAYVGSDEEASWLMDVPEPSLVTNSPTAPSMQAIQRDDGTASDQLTSPEGRGKVTLVDGHIPTTSFYSSSSAKKRSKPPSTLSSRPSESGRSKAKKHRPAKSDAKSSELKCRRTPASSGRKRNASLGTRSSDMCKQKAKCDRAGVRGAEKKFPRVADHEDVAVVKNSDNSSLSLFACDLKLRSLPPTPPGLLENILGVASPNQMPEEFATVQSEEGAEAQAPPQLPDICEPVVFDTAEVDLTAGINIDDILDRLDDANALESIYWSFTELPRESLKEWELHAIEMEPHKAVFGFIKDTMKLIVSLGDFVRQPGSTDKDALVKRTTGGVPRRTKLISALSFQVNCLPRAHINQYLLKRHLPETFRTDELLKQYPTTDSLGKMLGELGAFVVRHRPLSQDVACATVYRPYSFNYPVLSIHIIAPRRLVWFHLDLPIDLDTYPHGEILPSSRPYSDKYHDIKTTKLRRITAHVKPGPKYLTRMVEEIEAFIKR